MKAGSYVLATKWHDGDPGDHFAVGFYVKRLERDGDVRHLVADGEGRLFRANGFRRVKAISRRRGAWLVSRLAEIEAGSRSVWWWARARMGEA